MGVSKVTIATVEKEQIITLKRVQLGEKILLSLILILNHQEWEKIIMGEFHLIDRAQNPSTQVIHRRKNKQREWVQYLNTTI